MIQPDASQLHDLETLAQADYRAMLNIQTGYGKTVLGTQAHVDSNSDVTLIICPLQTMASAWTPTFQAMTGVEPRVLGNKNKAERQALLDFEWGVPGVYMVTPQLFARKSTDVSEWCPDLLIVDESHQIATPGTNGQRKLCGYTLNEHRTSLTLRTGGVMMMSGTILRNRFETAWTYGRTLWPHLDKRGQIGYDNFWMWKQDRMVSTSVWVKRNGVAKSLTQFTDEREPGLWVSEAPCVITHLKRERCCDFHPTGFLPLDEPVVKHETIALTAEQKRIIRELEDTTMTWLGDNPLVADIPLTQKQRIRQATLGVMSIRGEDEVFFEEDCKSPHIDRLIEILQDDIEDETALVFTDSQRFASVVTARLNKAGVSAFEFSGKTTNTRDADIAQFGGRFRVMVAVISAGGTGLDKLQGVCNNEIWLSRSLDETDNEQAMGRLDRRGQRKQVMRWVFHDSEGVSEEDYWNAMTKRAKLKMSLTKGAI